MKIICKNSQGREKNPYPEKHLVRSNPMYIEFEKTVLTLPVLTSDGKPFMAEGEFEGELVWQGEKPFEREVYRIIQPDTEVKEEKMIFKGTPGPWQIKHVEMGPVVATLAKNENDKFIKICVFPTATPKEISTSNAMLIAAAPELLEALQLIVRAHEHDNYELNELGLSKAKKAILKALGGKA